MSIRVMTAVWDRATEYAKGELLVLLALADWANDAGECWPSVPKIAQKSRLTERQTYKVLKQLQADGVITIRRGGGRGKFAVFQVRTDRFGAGRRGENTEINSVIPASETPKSATRNTEICDTKTLNSATEKGEFSCTPINRTVKEPPKQPSGETVSENHHLPYPLASERVKKPRVDGMTWGRFREGLRRQLEDAPLNHPNFSEVVKGEWDFSACFRDWWLIGLRPGEGGPGPPLLLTEAENVAATREGLRKYRKRIEALAVQHFGVAVEIVVLERKESGQ
jgi:hypothetical protein